MPTINIGLRKLYDPVGCDLPEGEKEFLKRFDLGSPYIGQVYLGTSPRFGVVVQQSDKFIVPVPEATNILTDINWQADASRLHVRKSLYAEFTVLRPFELSDKEFELFGIGDSRIIDTALSAAEEDAETLRHLMNLLAGIIGLRFHRQFVISTLNENFVAEKEPNPSIRIYTDACEVLDKVTLTQSGTELMSHMLSSLGEAQAERRIAAGQIFAWLLRAWGQSEPIDRFLSLFIPLECLVNGSGVTVQNSDKALTKQLRRLIKQHAGDRSLELHTYLNRLTENCRPSLSERFTAMAEALALPGWLDDVKAFREYNSIRNSLLHRGVQRVKTVHRVTENEVHSLEDIVERYVATSVFGKAEVYQSRWRPKRTVNA